MILYCDASAVAAVVLNESGAPAVDQLFRSTADIVVTGFVIAEVSSAIARLHRMAALEIPADSLFETLDEWTAAFARIAEVRDQDIWSAADLVRKLPLKLRSPDALHLAVCERLRARLITLDRNLASAAAVRGVDCTNPAELSARKD